MLKTRILFPVAAVVIALAAATWVYFTYNPGINAFFPRCPFNYLTGLDCPGCGSQRALHALLHGDIALAADHNLLMLASLPLLLVHFSVKTAGWVRGTNSRWKVLDHPMTTRIVLVFVLAFWLFRNIPVQPFSWLGSG